MIGVGAGGGVGVGVGVGAEIGKVAGGAGGTTGIFECDDDTCGGDGNLLHSFELLSSFCFATSQDGVLELDRSFGSSTFLIGASVADFCFSIEEE